MNGGPECEASEVASFFTNDATLLAPHEVPGNKLSIIEGRKAIEDYYHEECVTTHSLAGETPFEFKANQIQQTTFVDDKTAGHYGAADIVVRPVGGEDVAERVRHFVSLAKKVNGKYKVFLDSQSELEPRVTGPPPQ